MRKISWRRPRSGHFRPNMAAKLYERVTPVMNFCRLFGLGYLFNDSAIALTADTLLVLLNLLFTVYRYGRVMSFMKQQLPTMWTTTTMIMVVKVYTYLLTPMVTIVAWQFQKRALTDLFYRLDEIAPSVNQVDLRPFTMYVVVWYLLSASAKLSGYLLFQAVTKYYQMFAIFDCVIIVIYNVWVTAPLFHYVFLTETIRRAVLDINEQITSVNAWKTHRGRWKELRRSAVRLARNEFGVIIVTFVVCSIAEIVFFLFTLYFVAYKLFDMNPMSVVVHFVNVAFSASWLFEIFRVSQNCRKEMLKTQKILNSIKIITNSDNKELRYASLYMLHVDFAFMPCGIFEINYRNLIAIAMLIIAYVTSQIQMKLR